MRIRRRWRRRIRVTALLTVLALACIPVIAFFAGDGSEVAAVSTSDDATGFETSAVAPSTYIGSDMTEPEVKVPRRVSAISPAGMSLNVEFEATAIDDRDGELHPTCVPASGSLFSIGATVVTCTATDSADNVGIARLEVVVADGRNVPSGELDDQVLGATVTGGSGGTSDGAALAAAFAFIGAGFVSLAAGQKGRRVLARELARRRAQGTKATADYSEIAT